MKTGRVVIRSANRLKFSESVKPAMISSGAVSPMTRATASVTPVMIPAMAVGRTTLTMVRHFGTPRAYAASRSSCGTSLNISSHGADHDRDHQQRQRDRAAEAHPDALAEEQHEQRVGEEARDDRGDAGHHVDEEGDRARHRGPLAVLHEVDRGEQADRHGDDRGHQRDQQRAHDGVVDAAALADHVAHRVGEELRVDRRQALARRPARSARPAGRARGRRRPTPAR